MSSFQQAIDEKIKQLNQAAVIPAWRFKFDAPEGAQAPDFNDSDWGLVKLNYSWSSLDGEAWFRATVNPSVQVEGIDLTGCRLELDLILVLGATIYINGKEKYQEPSWAD